MAFQLPNQKANNKGGGGKKGSVLDNIKKKIASGVGNIKFKNKRTNLSKKFEGDPKPKVETPIIEKHRAIIESGEHVQGQIDWLNSKRGKAMLKESYGKGWKKIHKARLLNLSDTKSTVYDEQGWNERLGGENTLGASGGDYMVFNSPLIEKHGRKIEDVGAHEASHSGDILQQRKYKGLTKETGGKNSFSITDRKLDKLTRGEKGSAYLIPKTDSDLMEKLKPTPTTGGIHQREIALIKEWFPDDDHPFAGKNYDDFNEYWKESINQELARRSYLGKPTEIRARINTLREKSRQLGKDVFNEKMTKKDIEKLKDTPSYRDLLKIYDEKGILEMFNKISANTDDLDFNLEGATDKNINYA